ncbi:MAG: HDOD domain-containing protein [Gammaproteobacteria bacterium]|nr:MAG: HDOD domain-containing protein [Gammaproteobacteria bacterium]
MAHHALEATPRPIDLPHPPGEAFAVVRACADSRITARKLADIIQHDPVLSAEMLRIVNSPFFGFGGRIKSVPHAVSLLGQRSLRNIALCVALRDMVRRDSLGGFPLEAFWQASLWRAVCARVLAEETGFPEDEAFTFGLLQDFGYLMLFWLHRERIPDAERLRELDPAHRLDEERVLFGETHDQLARRLVAAWGLPEELALPIGHHHAPTFEGLEALQAQACRIALCADWMAAVFTTAERHAALARARAVVEEHLGLTREVFDRRMEAAVAGYREAGRAMSIPTGAARVSWDEVLREANLLLAEDNLSFQEQTWRLEQALSERDRMAEELHRELSLAREVQCSLLPERDDTLGMVAGCNVSARQVSGDFYDYFLTHDGQIQFAIADVSGKGMNAALLMAKTSSLFHCLGKAITNPALLAGMLNRELVEKNIGACS